MTNREWLALTLVAALVAGPVTAQIAQQPAAAAQQPPAPDPATPIQLRLEGAPLLQVVSIIAQELKINYVVDPQVKGVVTINATGELKRSDLLPLLQTILRINGAAIVQDGNLWRITLAKDAPRVPVVPQVDPRDLPADDRVVLEVIPLRFVAAGDMAKILNNYLSEIGNLVVLEAGNILVLTESSRNARRLMELLGIFDSEGFSGQRVRLYPMKNSTAKDMADELSTVFAAYSVSLKSALQFIPVERLNALLVISPNPATFAEVDKWVAKLDTSTRTSAIRNYVYKVENSDAEELARIMTQLYGGTYLGSDTSGRSSRSRGGSQTGAGTARPGGAATTQQQPGAAAPTRLVGTPLASGTAAEMQTGTRFVPDFVNNVLIVQATPPEWEEIRATLKELDIIPRQVLIEATIYEVNLNGALSMGVSAFLQNRSNTERKALTSFSAAAGGGLEAGLNFSFGTLIGQTRELVAFLNAQETRSRTRVIAAPTILASDNSEARIQVGAEVPVLTSVGFTGAQAVGGGSIFTNGVSGRDTGVILSVTPRINSGGLVSMKITQEVSVAQAPTNPAVPSPTIQKRAVGTQVTVQDGATIALGGIIQETTLNSRNRIPLLGDIPGLGLLFGSTSYSTQRTELIILLTPKVIRNLTEATDKTEELKKKLRGLRKMLEQTP